MKKLLLLLGLCCPMAAFSQTTPQSISTFPYIEDFENGPGGWTSASLHTGKSSWVFSQPILNIVSQKRTINYAANGSGYWVICDTTVKNPSTYLKYLNLEYSFVESPIFDLSSLNKPMIEFNLWWQTEFSSDGVSLQYLINNSPYWIRLGTYGDSSNWYNSIIGSMGPSWSGNSISTGSNGWITATHHLDSLIGQNNVKFRIIFKSDIFINDDGFGFDDFKIYEAGSITTGTFENKVANRIIVYPNPGSGYFKLQIPETNQPTTLKVYDLKGQLVKETNVLTGSRNAELNLTNQPKGIYLLKAEIGNKLYTQKLVIH